MAVATELHFGRAAERLYMGQAGAERADPPPGGGAGHPPVHAHHAAGGADRRRRGTAGPVQGHTRRYRCRRGGRPGGHRRRDRDGPAGHHPAGRARAGASPVPGVRRPGSRGQGGRGADVASRAHLRDRQRADRRGRHLRQDPRPGRRGERGVLRRAAAGRAAARAPPGRPGQRPAGRPGPGRARPHPRAHLPGLGDVPAAGPGGGRGEPSGRSRWKTPTCPPPAGWISPASTGSCSSAR